MMGTRMGLGWRVAFVVLTIASLFLAARLELSKDLTTLFPHTAAAGALTRITRAFGGGDVALLLVRGDDAVAVEKMAEIAAEELRTCPSIKSVLTSAPSSPPSTDPTEAWRFAGPTARDRLARAVSNEEEMRARLRDTRALLLAPGSSDASELLSRDPLRLGMIPWEDRIEIASGVGGGAANGAFVSNDGRARLVAIEPRGRAFEAGEAARFTSEADAAIQRAIAKGNAAGVRLDLTGGHVIARQTEAMIRGDLQKSGALSMLLASIVFLITFRRVRALIAVLPPLLIGTLWTTALAALLYPRLSAVATAFAAVVIGVGVDTGVHVYGRLLRARREGATPNAAAVIARRDTWKPTLSAAGAAGAAFGCLVLSEIEGMRQLGILCAAGEVLTAVAILLVVPEIGARLERSSEVVAPLRAQWAVALTATRSRALLALALVAAGVAGGIAVGPPTIDHGVAALDARTLPALATYEAIYSTFGGARGQLAVVATERDTGPFDRVRVRARADAVAEAADKLLASGAITGFDALARIAPSPGLQAMRLGLRDKLDLPSKRALLERALVAEGFAVEAFGPALEAFEHPSKNTADVLSRESDGAGAGPLDWLRRRHLAEDEQGLMAVTYVRVKPGAEDIVLDTLKGADPESLITGFAQLERSLAHTLETDLPRVLMGALGIVVLVLGASLRDTSRVLLAVLVLLVEVAIVVALSRPLGVRWHVYDALVLPVLLGITLDEVLFLLDAAERTTIEDALAEQAPLGTATALTTAAGFGALVICRFRGLIDVGKVGALGSIVGLLVAVVVIPAVYRLKSRK